MKFGTIVIHSDDYIESRVVGGSAFTYLASYLNKYMNGDIKTYLELDAKKLIEAKPDVVGISTVTQNFNKSVEIAKAVRENLGNIPILFGGPHITNLPKDLPKSMDIGIQSEGEETLLELMQLIKSRDINNKDKLKNVLGISYHGENNEVIVNKARPLINNLDSIPIPKFSLLNLDYGFKHAIFTSRGCPYKCSFCSSTKMWNKARLHSAERVLTEIEFVMKHYPDQDFIGLGDDLFTMSLPRLRKIVELIRERKIHKKIKFTASVRTSNFDEETAYLLRKMNVSTLFFGFESGDERVLTELKCETHLKDNERAIKLSEKYGMRVHGGFILASPSETKEELAKTYWFINSNIKGMERVIISNATPFPNTNFWDFAIKEKIISENFNNWDSLNMEYNPDISIFLNKSYSRDEYTNYFSIFRELSYNHTENIMKKINDFHLNKQLLSTTLENISQYFINKTFYNVLEISNQNELLEDYLPENVKIKRIEVSEIENLNQNKKFDGIFLIQTLEKMKKPEDILKKLGNLLSHDAHIIIVVNNVQNSAFISKIAKGYSELKTSDINYYSENTLKELVNKLGFKIIEFRENFIKSNNINILEEKILLLFSKYINTEEIRKNSYPKTYTIILKKISNLNLYGQ